MVADALAFLGVSALVIVTPGQDTALTIRNTLFGGRRAGVRTAAGVACGQAFWTFAASVGLAAVVSASEPAFVAVRLAGAAYWSTSVFRRSRVLHGTASGRAARGARSARVS